MKTITFNNKQYQVPQSWSEVTLQMQITATAISSTQDYIKTLGVMSAYTKIPVEDLKHAEIHEMKSIMEALAFVDKEVVVDKTESFVYSGETYSVGQSIIKQEWQDYVSIQTAIAKYQDDVWTQLAYIVAVMAKKEGETLDDFDVNDRAKHLMGLDVQTCQNVAGFFLNSQMALESITALSSPAVVVESLRNKVQQLDDSLKTLKQSRGGNLLIILWIMIIRKWTKYSMRQWEKYFNSPASSNSKKNSNKNWKPLRLRKHAKNR